MALNIKDPETEKAVRTLARRRGLTLTQAVRQAVDNELDKDELPPEEKERRIAESKLWLAEFYRKYDIKPAERSMTKEEMTTSSAMTRTACGAADRHDRPRAAPSDNGSRYILFR